VCIPRLQVITIDPPASNMVPMVYLLHYLHYLGCRDHRGLEAL
jgi:hypothetical protein